MAKTDDIVTLSEGKGRNKIVYHYTDATIKRYVKDELIAAVEAGEKSPFMRLLHLRKGNLNFVKKDCAGAILDKINDFKNKVNKDENIAIEYISGGYVDTINKIIDETIDGLVNNVNFAKKMIKENPIQVIELGLFKEFINADDKIFVLLFNSLLASKDLNAEKLADKLFSKYIANDSEKLMLIAKNPNAEKYVKSVLQGDQISGKVQYAKFTKIAIKNNPQLWNCADINKLTPADILSIVKTNILSVPSVVTLLTYLDGPSAKRYLKIMIKHSNKLLQEKFDEINEIEDIQERKQTIDQFKVEAKAYLGEFRNSANLVANYVEECEIIELNQKTEELNKEAFLAHNERKEEFNKQYSKAEKTANKILNNHRNKKTIEALESVTEEDCAYIFMEVSKDMGIKNFEKDESETFKNVLKSKLKEIDKKFPKDSYPDNNKELKKKAIKETLKDLLAGKVRTKLGQKLHNASLPRREKIAKKLTDERVSILIDEKYSELIEDFENKYNSALLQFAELRDNKVNASIQVAQKQIKKNEDAKNRKVEKLNKKKEELLDTIKSEEDLGI